MNLLASTRRILIPCLLAASFLLPVSTGLADAPHSGKTASDSWAEPILGQGRSGNDELVSFYISAKQEQHGIIYRLFDETGPAAIRTFDYRSPADDEDGNTGYSYASSDSPFFADTAAVHAHINAKRVYLYYKNRFGRNSIDDRNMDIVSYVHVDKDSARNNAFWAGDAIYYGEATGLKDGGVNCTSCAFDIVAHELTHGVIQYTVGLENRGQSGSLGEAIADIMAAAMDADDWEIGEESGAAVRSLADPGKYGQPAHMRHYVRLPEDEQHDWGGVHINSGIPARAGYLMALKIGNADIGLEGRDMLARLTYAILRDKLISPKADFYEARKGYLAAVYRLDSLTDEQRQVVAAKVNEAWLTVGIGEHPPEEQ